MSVVFEKPKSLTDATLHYCPGCTHGIIHRLVAEVIDELGIEGDTIGVASVGCSVMAHYIFAAGLLVQSIYVLRHNTLKLSCFFKLCQLVMRNIWRQ